MAKRTEPVSSSSMAKRTEPVQAIPWPKENSFQALPWPKYRTRFKLFHGQKNRTLFKLFFCLRGCSHAYCADCMAKYLTLKVQDNITSIRCPVSNCRGSLDPEYCRKILPQHVFDRVPWHSEIECKEFQKLKQNERESEDIMLMKLAKNKNWQRCPNCKYFVEKKSGCMYMKCRCGTAFCYDCGNVAGYMNHLYHYCAKCKR
ncbi:hypothetical protein ACOSQ2_008908 [Xanthoceras sorbifolium]